MNRRHFLATTAAVTAFPLASFASEFIAYQDGFIKQALADGKTVFVDYATDWCSTCAAQERMIERLRGENPDYDKHITFVRVDYDQFGNAPVSTDRGIPRRSTLIVLKGDDELGRVVAAASHRMIKALLDAGLNAATS
ncbi:hypothetical protein GCM10008927_13130 [Amylibacter ulvae]|uniref:Thioredoxin domain-containing protein n=1 Tax=Paramylibacter ulvae TaxID=1651968 RepID=A0ABQ3CYU7_9RHOB|nr:thioredoxin family protein [Amylibacter ulvae]GHA49321.1 hypothetical protein GCM10008927_13130 [Amylibacter ulvae]